MAVRPPLENRTYIAKFWTFAYAREAKFERSRLAPFADVNTAVRTLSETLHTCRMGRCSISSLFDVNRYTFDENVCEKRFLHFRSILTFDLLIIELHQRSLASG